jgi:hypothetical protein
MNFAENLARLPVVDHLFALQLTQSNSASERIENQPGSSGSVRVYAYLAGQHGCINVAAAEEGLSLYAEHADDARAHPGKHPNIDRLLVVLAGGPSWMVSQEPA